MEKYQFIDPEYYLSQFKEVDWYLKLRPEIERLLFEDAQKEAKEKLYQITAEALRLNRIKLGSSGEDWDEERKNIDTVVIHHTSTRSDLSLVKLSAMGLLRLYCPRYWAEGGETRCKRTAYLVRPFPSRQTSFLWLPLAN
jgi:hypothetical protein